MLTVHTTAATVNTTTAATVDTTAAATVHTVTASTVSTVTAATSTANTSADAVNNTTTAVHTTAATVTAATPAIRRRLKGIGYNHVVPDMKVSTHTHTHARTHIIGLELSGRIILYFRSIPAHRIRPFFCLFCSLVGNQYERLQGSK